MLKDVVVNLSGRGQRDFAAEYAISIAATFAAHITGLSFVYEPVIPDGTLACWDGSRTAARAIGDAMPFLERAKAVDIVIVAEERKSEEMTGANMSAHLARHGVTASIKRMAKGDIGIEDVLLSYAADSGADFMVMGGYGHSRLREFILGGVTRGIL